MASEHLDIVRAIYSDWERGDFSSAAWADPEIEFAFAGGPEPGNWSGLAGMSEGYRKWLKAWDGFRAEPEEYLVLDEERVLVLVRNSGRGRTSGLELEERSVANLFHLRRGKVIRVVVYLDRELAFAELGLAADSRVTEVPPAQD
jgi:ketosteroid isomerase-like protein